MELVLSWLGSVPRQWALRHAQLITSPYACAICSHFASNTRTLALLRQPLVWRVAVAATNQRDRAPMSEATYSSWMQLVMCVAEAVWRPRGDSARTAVATAHANCPSSARSQRQPLVWPMQPPIGVIVRQ